MAENTRIRYKHHSGNGRWYEWDMTARVIDETSHEVIVSLRPLLGTSSVRITDVLSRESVTSAVTFPKRVQGGQLGSSND